MFDHISITGSKEDLAMAIREGTAVAVCDGSYMPKADKKRGSTCLIIECQLTKTKLVMVCQSPGTYTNAYRSEMMGLYASMCITHAFCLAYDIEARTMSISCDNDGALWKTAMDVPKMMTSHTRTWIEFHNSTFNATRRPRSFSKHASSKTHCNHTDTTFSGLEVSVRQHLDVRRSGHSGQRHSGT
eukprot:scaffold20541_cov58-Attheya_sp.AAC.5